jgi:hypothetical protein
VKGIVSFLDLRYLLLENNKNKTTGIGIKKRAEERPNETGETTNSTEETTP